MLGNAEDDRALPSARAWRNERYAEGRRKRRERTQPMCASAKATCTRTQKQHAHANAEGRARDRRQGARANEEEHMRERNGMRASIKLIAHEDRRHNSLRPHVFRATQGRFRPARRPASRGLRQGRRARCGARRRRIGAGGDSRSGRLGGGRHPHRRRHGNHQPRPHAGGDRAAARTQAHRRRRPSAGQPPSSHRRPIPRSRRRH